MDAPRFDRNNMIGVFAIFAIFVFGFAVGALTVHFW
jgi:hypothetical protein